MKLISALLLLGVALPTASLRAEPSRLLVHEWGTFTSFQDSRGITIPGINVDDEPVPKFVHRLGELPIFTTQSPPAQWSQGAPRCHADVTLRLETPVLYFYPQPGYRADQSFDVRASFVGGWLTEFFPSAKAENPGFPEALDRTMRGSLQWSDLRLAPDSIANLPQTTERVWLAPRKVRSAVVATGDPQEAEKYLFYRGVGQIDAPIAVRMEERLITISLRDGERLLKKLPAIWIVQVLPDGRVAYRTAPVDEKGSVTVSMPPDTASSGSDIDALRRELADALVAQGLFKEEAQAMLETWQLSYFESEGLRVFFVLPASWTDAYLPLSISTPADTTRVMLGRVELISAHQRSALQRLYELPATAFDLTPPYYESQAVLSRLQEGTGSHAEYYRMLGRDVPEALKLYDSLGRFRDALLAHEWHSTSDQATRTRLELVMARFSSCVSDLSNR